MRRPIWIIAAVLLAGPWWFYGCAPGWQFTQNGSNQAAKTKEIYRLKALEAEKQGRLQTALWFWRAAAALDTGDTTTAGTIKTLKRAISNAAKIHYRKGLAYYQKDDHDRARNAFLTALRINPAHARARHYLKTILPNRTRNIHTVQKGDSFSKIAVETYNDPSKAGLIAYFNNMTPTMPLYIGKKLILPDIEARQLQPRVDINALIEEAQKALSEGNYKHVHQLCARIRAESPKNAKAQALIQEAYYRKGIERLEQKQYLEALNNLKQVPKGYRKRDRAIAAIQRRLSSRATEQKLAEAEQYLQQKDYTAAIDIADTILAVSPGNKRAQELADRARYALGKHLIDGSEDEKALEILSRLDSGYEDTAQMIAHAKGRLNARAEALYRSGVKHFLNEELEKAIQDWEKALSLNPNHPKAAQDIENAERLLNKWRGLEKED